LAKGTLKEGEKATEVEGNCQVLLETEETVEIATVELAVP